MLKCYRVSKFSFLKVSVNSIPRPPLKCLIEMSNWSPVHTQRCLDVATTLLTSKRLRLLAGRDWQKAGWEIIKALKQYLLSFVNIWVIGSFLLLPRTTRKQSPFSMFHKRICWLQNVRLVLISNKAKTNNAKLLYLINLSLQSIYTFTRVQESSGTETLS